MRINFKIKPLVLILFGFSTLTYGSDVLLQDSSLNNIGVEKLKEFKTNISIPNPSPIYFSPGESVVILGKTDKSICGINIEQNNSNQVLTMKSGDKEIIYSHRAGVLNGNGDVDARYTFKLPSIPSMAILCAVKGMYGTLSVKELKDLLSQKGIALKVYANQADIPENVSSTLPRIAK